MEGYGLRCMVALARKGTAGQLSISEIAQLEGLSIPYTSKLLSSLRKIGLVESVRGRKGGFRIAREPDKVHLLDVIVGLGGPLIDPEHCRRFSGQLDECVHHDNCNVHYLFGGLARYIADFLNRTTLQDLVEDSGPHPSGSCAPATRFDVSALNASLDGKADKQRSTNKTIDTP